MSQANNAEPYRQVMNNDVQTAAKSVPGFRVVVSDAAQDNSKQVADVENFLTQKINLLIISPNEAKPLTAVVKKAYDQGVPVIVLDRKVEGRRTPRSSVATTWRSARRPASSTPRRCCPTAAR
ncbi:substrate-binding domain-containing protein [Micromonospora sp. BRA006-A]|nr:substrate-binding domain-containing protein [Micromonospora sp. BRA006-A]